MRDLPTRVVRQPGILYVTCIQGGVSLRAIRALFGFVLEGRPEPDDVDAFKVPVHGFDVIDPNGPTREERDAERATRIARMGAPRMFRMQSDGSFVEVDRL